MGNGILSERNDTAVGKLNRPLDDSCRMPLTLSPGGHCASHLGFVLIPAASQVSIQRHHEPYIDESMVLLPTPPTQIVLLAVHDRDGAARVIEKPLLCTCHLRSCHRGHEPIIA
jgi:hypothetical protein